MFGYRIAEILAVLPPTLSVCGEPALEKGNPEDKVMDQGRSTSRANDIDRMVTAYKSLDFGWRLVRALIRGRHELPPELSMSDDPAIVRAYLWERRASEDAELAAAAAFGCDPRMKEERDVLEALMLCSDYDRTWVAKEFDTSEGVLDLYDQLFFNVVDRKTEDNWLVSHVYKETKIEEFIEGYICQKNATKIVKRAGYNNGMAAVLQLVGSRAARQKVAAMTLSDTRKAFEQEITRNGLLLAQNGWAGQSDNATAIRRSQSMISAAKLGGEDQGASGHLFDNDMGFSLYHNMKSDLRAQAKERNDRAHAGKN